MAMAVFTSRPNSHPFEERRVPLTEPVKIGRSVAKSRPATNNCIFDCKVLSRNHAILWYEDGKVSMTSMAHYKGDVYLKKLLVMSVKYAHVIRN